MKDIDFELYTGGCSDYRQYVLDKIKEYAGSKEMNIGQKVIINGKSGIILQIDKYIGYIIVAINDSSVFHIEKIRLKDNNDIKVVGDITIKSFGLWHYKHYKGKRKIEWNKIIDDFGGIFTLSSIAYMYGFIYEQYKINNQ